MSPTRRRLENRLRSWQREYLYNTYGYRYFAPVAIQYIQARLASLRPLIDERKIE